MSKPILITCQPDDQYFLWQNHLYIESCLEQGFSEEQIHILLYKPTYRVYNKNWEKLKTIYPKLNIFLYEDKGVQQFLGIYIPIIRPHILFQHFEAFPELKNKTIIYTDCDILWVGNLDIKQFFNDNISYMSDAKSYLNYDYLKSKEKDVLEHKKEDFSKIDVIQEMCDIVGISKEIVIKNNDNTGGVQYILKNIDKDFWLKVEKDVLAIRSYLLNINKLYFENENKGYQSWCADLWAVLWGLWIRNQETKIIKQLDFAWAPDPISKLETYSIFHNAGITGTFIETGSHEKILKSGQKIKVKEEYPAFYKGKYHAGQDPTKDEHLQIVLENEESKKHCTWWYAKKLNDLKNKYKLNY